MPTFTVTRTYVVCQEVDSDGPKQAIEQAKRTPQSHHMTSLDVSEVWRLPGQTDSKRVYHWHKTTAHPTHSMED